MSKESAKKWAQDHPEQHKDNLKKFHEQHPEKQREYQAKWNAEHKEEIKAYRRKWANNKYQENKESILAANKKRRLEDPDFAIRGKLCRFGVTLDWFKAQGDTCSICGKQETSLWNNGKKSKVQKLSIDHNHACCNISGKSCGKCVRGLLCSRCNVALHLIENDPEWGNKALAYLAKFNQLPVSIVEVGDSDDNHQG